MKEENGMITECVTNVIVKDTLLLTARVRVLKQEDAMSVKSEVILPEIDQ